MQKKESAFSGALWLLTGSAAQSLIKALITAVLARMISPADFGLAAAGMSVVMLANLLNGAGSGSYLVQVKQVRNEHFNTVFTYSIVAGILTGIIIFLLRGIISGFFQMPELASILSVLIVIFPVQAIYRVSYSYLQRNLLFTKMAGLDVLSYVVAYGGLGLVLAYYGFGVWALIYAAIGQSVLYSWLLLTFVPVKFSFSIDRNILKDVTRTGLGYLFVNLLSYATRQGDFWVVGRMMGATALGYYSRAFNLMMAPHSIIGSVMNKVLFAKFSRLQDDLAGQRITLKRVLSILISMGLPFTIFCIWFAKEIVLLLLGENWLEVVLPLRVLAAAIIARIGFGMLTNYLLGVGLLRDGVFFYVMQFLLVIGGAVSGAAMDNLVAVTLGVTAGLLISFVILLIFALRQSSISVEFLMDILLKNTVILLPFVFLTWVTDSFLFHGGDFHFLYRLLSGGVTFIILYGIYLRFRVYKILGQEMIWLVEEKVMPSLRKYKL